MGLALLLLVGGSELGGRITDLEQEFKDRAGAARSGAGGAGGAGGAAGSGT